MKQAGWQNLKSDVKTYWKGILAAAVFLMAMLIVQVIAIVLCIVMYAICGAALFAAFSAAGYSLIG